MDESFEERHDKVLTPLGILRVLEILLLGDKYEPPLI
jgi:hypothetical protein